MMIAAAFDPPDAIINVIHNELLMKIEKARRVVFTFNRCRFLAFVDSKIEIKTLPFKYKYTESNLISQG